MTEDERCILCGSGEVEDVENFLVRCNEFQEEREELLERVWEIEGADVWVEAFCRAGNEQRTAMMLGKQVEGLDAVVVERVDNLVMGAGGRRGRNWLLGSLEPLTILVLNPPPPPPPPAPKQEQFTHLISTCITIH